jgi:hypothetical protein
VKRDRFRERNIRACGSEEKGCANPKGMGCFHGGDHVEVTSL